MTGKRYFRQWFHLLLHVTLFSKDEYEFDPAEEAIVEIQATHFTTVGSIVLEGSKELPSPVSLAVKSQKSNKSIRVKASPGGTGILSYTIKGAIGDSVEIIPEHKTLLFSPKTLQVC